MHLRMYLQELLLKKCLKISTDDAAPCILGARTHFEELTPQKQLFLIFFSEVSLTFSSTSNLF